MIKYVIVTLDYNFADEFDTPSLWLTTEDEYKDFLQKVRELNNYELEYYFGTNEAIIITPSELLNSLTYNHISEITYKEMTKVLGSSFGIVNIQDLLEQFQELEE